jgi:hypothetical protein
MKLFCTPPIVYCDHVKEALQIKKTTITTNVCYIAAELLSPLAKRERADMNTSFSHYRRTVGHSSPNY